MDFDKCALINEMDLHTHRKDWFNAGRAVFRFYASFGDNIVFVPQGLAVLLRENLPISKATSFRVVQDLQAYNVIEKENEFTLQMHPALSMKGETKVRYKGTIWQNKGNLNITKMSSEREKLWESRGKNKKYTAKEKNMRNLARKIDSLEELLKGSVNELKKGQSEMESVIVENIQRTENNIVNSMITALRLELGLTDPDMVERVVKRTFQVYNGGKP